MKNKKLKVALSLTGYLLLIIALCFAGVMIFHSSYYDLIYVSGGSMYPTLNGSDDEASGTVVDFGIVDSHKSAINHIERFDIVSTYFPSDYDASGNLLASATKKIKRVIGMPNDTFTIKDGLLSVKKGEEFVSVPYNFKVVETDQKDIESKTLGEDEYWLLGDNRVNSNDCAIFNKPVTKKQIIGVLVAIEGKAKLKLKNYRCDKCGQTSKTGGKCSRYNGGATCNGNLIAQYDLANKQYFWPKYY